MIRHVCHDVINMMLEQSLEPCPRPIAMHDWKGPRMNLPKDCKFVQVKNLKQHSHAAPNQWTCLRVLVFGRLFRGFNEPLFATRGWCSCKKSMGLDWCD